MYHRIASDNFDPWGLAVSPERFEHQIEWLRRARVVLPLEIFAKQLIEGTLPSQAVAITFDDAYAQTIRTALPLLTAQKVPATVFVPAALVSDQRPFWWDELARIVIGYAASEILVDGKNVPVPKPLDADARWPAGDPASTPRQRLYLSLWSTLRSRNPSEITEYLESARIRGLVPPHAGDAYVPMTAAELQSSSSDYVSFGSHALSHRPLTSLDPADRWREISESAAACTALTGTTPTSFAYPFGDYDRETADMVRDAGFTCACTTENAFTVKKTSPLMIPRIQVGDWEPSRMARALAGL